MDNINDTPSRKVILIADDEEVLRTLYKEVLADAGFDVFAASNGVEALKVYQEQNPALIITDINMPIMNGCELIRSVRRLDHNIPIIAISSEEESLAQALKDGANVKISKMSEIIFLVEYAVNLTG